MLEHSAILGIVRADVLEFEMNLDVMALLRLCDPAIGIDSEDEFKAFWATARFHIDAIPNPLSFASICLPQSSFNLRTEDQKIPL